MWITKNNHIEVVEKLRELKENTEETFNWVDCGGCLVRKEGNLWLLYEIPMYGGKEIFEGSYSYGQLFDLVGVMEKMV